MRILAGLREVFVVGEASVVRIPAGLREVFVVSEVCFCREGGVRREGSLSNDEASVTRDALS